MGGGMSGGENGVEGMGGDEGQGGGWGERGEWREGSGIVDARTPYCNIWLDCCSSMYCG